MSTLIDRIRRPRESQPVSFEAQRIEFAEERAGFLVAPSILDTAPQRALAPERLTIAHSLVALPAIAWATADFFLATFAVLLAHMLSPAFDPGRARYDEFRVAVTFAIFFVFSSYILGMYARQIFNQRKLIASKALAAAAVSMGALVFALTFVGYVQLGRYILILTVLLSALFQASARIAVNSAATMKRMRILFVAPASKFAYLVRSMRLDFSELYARPVFIEPSGTPEEVVARVRAAFHVHRPHKIVIDDDNELLAAFVGRAAEFIRDGVVLRTLSSFHEDLLEQVAVDSIDCRSLVGKGLQVGRYSAELSKRAFDIAVSGFGFVVAIPLMLAIAAVLRVVNGSPVLYHQDRVGRFGRTFRIHKFRTMRNDAENGKAVWASKGDPRATRLGRVLRKTRLDELPQLWNILVGDMSFVGPRPERPEFVDQLATAIPYYQLRHIVRPGLTGWAQIRYRYGANEEDARRKLAYDLYYVRRCSVVFDIAICARTAMAMARGAQ